MLRRSSWNVVQRLGCLLVTVSVSLAPRLAAGQFRTPVTGHFASDVVRRDVLLKTLAKLGELAQIEKRPIADSAAALCADELAVRAKADRATCESVANELREWPRTRKADDTRNAPSLQTTRLRLRLPGSHGRSEILSYLVAASVDDNIGLMGDLVATASSGSAYVASDVIGGLLGRSLFSLTYARVVVRDTLADTLTKEIVMNDAAAMQRMLNNGGTIAARFVLPVYAAGGVTSQRAVSIYPVIGLDGPLNRPDSLAFVVSGVAEYVNSMAIRAPNASATELGTLELSTRAGYIRSDHALVSAAGASKGSGFIQVGVGLRQNGKIGVSALYTRTTNKDVLGPYYPRFLVSFSALKM